MCSKFESKTCVSVPKNTLDMLDFYRHDRFKEVNKIFAEKMPDGGPVPRPVRGHTMDFALTCHGATVLDGECKDKAFIEGPEASVLVLHSMDQLTWRDTVLSLLTTSKGMSVYESFVDDITNTRVTTNAYSFQPSYDLQHPVFVSDPDSEGEVPKFFYEVNGRNYTYCDADQMVYNGGTDELSYATEKSNWQNLQPNCRDFIAHILSVVDFLVCKLSAIDHANLKERVQEAWECGLRDPSFATPREPGKPIRTRVPQQNKFIYTMDIGAEPSKEEKLVGDIELLDFILENEEIADKAGYEEIRDAKKAELDKLVAEAGGDK